jgi:hypothetical protein
MKSLIVEVIAVYEGDLVVYYTKEGLEIGSLKGGVKVKKKDIEIETNKKPNSKIIKPMTPEQREKFKEQEAAQLLDQRNKQLGIT